MNNLNKTLGTGSTIKKPDLSRVFSIQFGSELTVVNVHGYFKAKTHI
ncbi:hypothetical protein Q7C_2053 [Methylophaga frappieri]|uniref:Uncharacterized protein n=1 Tax=Methylophaga frappieri (strain ATCC BAA-2434 / DSM 25690 / JAM7) TaxID=754477 RepID=I1YJU9_METFJ|nr:hypothetical protein Q7C_2053 [Methylophaga frappieri]